MRGTYYSTHGSLFLHLLAVRCVGRSVSSLSLLAWFGSVYTTSCLGFYIRTLCGALVMVTEPAFCCICDVVILMHCLAVLGAILILVRFVCDISLQPLLLLSGARFTVPHRTVTRLLWFWCLMTNEWYECYCSVATNQQSAGFCLRRNNLPACTLSV